ncbi:hypothetical protein [Pseudenhygromyxa sp. WMMC2535]|nr:hypothetical protein [Pseudenhygromyxa sp. WMMC2535]
MTVSGRIVERALGVELGELETFGSLKAGLERALLMQRLTIAQA